MADDSVAAAAQARDLRPVPDPTALTTQALIREITALRELMEARLDASQQDRGRLHEMIEAFPNVIDEKVNQLRLLHEEKFRSIQVQFAERDIRSDQNARILLQPQGRK